MTLTWCCYYLTLNPDIQQKLQDEVDALFERESNPSYDEYMQMKYMTMVLKETLRIVSF
jgi:cytochrome P450